MCGFGRVGIVLAKFLIYGCIGLVAEVCFTGVSAAIFDRDRSATGKTYLWMHPIYGATMLGLEWLGGQLAFLPWAVRGLVYVAVIYAVEFSSGWLLRTLLGRCPWDYGRRGLNIKGLVRLDYAPVWYLAAVLFEPVRIGLGTALHAVALGQVLADVVRTH
jgi:uncharacterized membrane protein